jgi:hypothetical protein
MRRYAAAVGVALVLFIGALPAAAACCMGAAPSSAEASMHAAMPCCAAGTSCNLTTSKTNRDHEIALNETSSLTAPLQLVAVVTTAAVEPVRPGFARSSELTANEFSAPPPFLLHSQFRI